MRTLGLVSCLVAAGCSKKDEPALQPEPAAQPAPTGQDSAPSPSQPTEPSPTPGDMQPAGTPDTQAGQPSPPPPSDTAAPTPPPAPAQGSVAPEDPKNREWTAGIVEVTRSSLKPVTLRSVREGRHEGFDRVVFEFEGEQVPGYHLEYVDKPIIQCGSGHPTEVAGQGWLQVRLTPAQAHEGGQVTVADRERQPRLPVIQELELTCDFEGEVTWVLGNASPNKYRVMELREPARLVVDVRH